MFSINYREKKIEQRVELYLMYKTLKQIEVKRIKV